MERLMEKGYAKINLHLDVLGRMENGYHLVETVMQTISLCDEITLTRREEKGITITSDVDTIPLDDTNLALRAAELFFEAMGERYGLAVHIDKRIPIAAGLAGGSADAAAVLRGLNRMHRDLFSLEDLCDLGSHLGVDVPFCIVGGTAYADGRGDRISALSPMPDCHILCALGGESVLTPWAYGVLDQRYGNFSEADSYRPKGCDDLRAALEEANAQRIAKATYNVFEEPILSLRPVASELRRVMEEEGALAARMSGSGPSVFGIFADERARDAAALRLREMGARVDCAKPVGRLW